MADQTVVLFGKYGIGFNAFPPALGAGAGNGNDVNVFATVKPRAPVAVGVRTANAVSDGSQIATVMLRTPVAVGVRPNNLPSIPVSVVLSAPWGICLSEGATLTRSAGPIPTVGVGLGVGCANLFGAGATVSGVVSVGVGFTAAALLSADQTASALATVAVGFGAAPATTLTQSPLLSASMAIGLRQRNSVSGVAGTPTYVTIKARPRGGAAKAIP